MSDPPEGGLRLDPKKQFHVYVLGSCRATRFNTSILQEEKGLKLDVIYKANVSLYNLGCWGWEDRNHTEGSEHTEASSHGPIPRPDCSPLYP